MDHRKIKYIKHSKKEFNVVLVPCNIDAINSFFMATRTKKKHAFSEKSSIKNEILWICFCRQKNLNSSEG